MKKSRAQNQENFNSDCGIRMGELWKVSKLMRHMGISAALLKKWIAAGLVVRDLGSDSPFILTDDLFAFYRNSRVSSPTIVPDALYTSAQVIALMGIAKATLQKWMKQGLKSAMRGSRTRFFLGRHIIDFLFEGES